MTAESYQKLTAWWRAHPSALSIMLAVNKALKYLGYIAYPLLLVLVALFDRETFARMFLVPLVGFVVVTVVRRVVNEPRPYEALAIDPLIHKDTVGKSFPSRHLFSMVMIAMCWLVWCMPVGIVFLMLCAVMGYVRVVGGVHYVHDVVVGALFGIVLGIVGFWIVPM